MSNAPLTLHEARTYGALAAAAALTASAGVAAGADAAYGAAAALLVGAAVATTTVGGALAAVRLLVTRDPRRH
jgi:hypothetical protein